MNAGQNISVPDTPAEVLAFVLSSLGRPASQDVIESACAGLQADDGLYHLAEAASLLGLVARVGKGVPEAWRDGRDGALVVLRNKKFAAQVRHNGTSSPVTNLGGAVWDSVSPNETVMHIEPASNAEAAAVTYSDLVERARRTVRRGVGQSLAINLCALTVPFFTMAVYDRVLGGAAVSSLPALLSGAALVLAIMFLLRRVRSQMLSAEYAGFGATVSMALAQRLFRQPFMSLNRTDAETAMARLRGAERTADLFASSNTAAIYDAPFVVVTLIALIIVGGALAVIPALYLVIFLFIGVVLGWTRPAADPLKSELAARYRAMVSDLPHAGQIRRSGLGDVWLKRFDQLSRASARATHAAQQRPALIQSVGTALGTGTALVTLIVGLDLALQGRLSPGTLIGTMLLTWRITGPAQGLFLAIPRLRVLRDAWMQLKPLMEMPVLPTGGTLQDLEPGAPVAVKAEGLFLRYENGADPALTGVSFEIPAGSVVAVIGPNGAGKSSLLRMIAGVVGPQSGRLMLNGKALSQFGADGLAEQIAFLPSDPRSVLPHDMSSEISHDIGEVEAENMAWERLAQRDASMFVLDDPLAIGGAESRSRVADFIKSKQAISTVVFATHDTELVQLAELAIVLDHGSLIYFGPVSTPQSDTAQDPTKETLS